MTSSPDHAAFFFKIVLAGDYKTGKTSLLYRYMNQDYTLAENSTVNVDFSVKIVERNKRKIKLQIWDTAGQERFRTAVAAYYRGARGVLLVYDITNRESFHNIGFWYEEMIRSCDPNSIKAILIGSKCHLECDREVSSNEGKTFAHQFDLTFFEVSAEKNINVTECFEELVDSILDGINQHEINRALEGMTLPNDHVSLRAERHEVEGCDC